MEQHPVPQNVTTFQFRLIGDMTIKQFGYLAGGAILAYISYKLPLPFFFSWPLAFIFGIGGVGFAFVPIEERPMDVWVLSFLKNVYSPTQFIWTQDQKPAAQPAAIHAQQPAPTQTKPSSAASHVVQQIYAPKQSAPTIQAAPHAIKPGFFDQLQTFFAPKHRASAPVAAAAQPVPTPSVTGTQKPAAFDFTPPPKVTKEPDTTPAPKAEEMLAKEHELEEKAKNLEKVLQENSQTSARVLELQKQLTEMLTQRDQMEKELEKLRSAQPTSATPQQSQQSHPTHISQPTTPKQPSVRIITPEAAVNAGLPRLTTFPNVVTGVIRDSDNNLLPGVLVTVKDKEGIPLRALKTNRLGQFAASTPIPNGVYLVEIEDPRSRFIFDRVQITLNGSIVPALEIFAKSQKQMAREKLAKEIFGGV